MVLLGNGRGAVEGLGGNHVTALEVVLIFHISLVRLRI